MDECLFSPLIHKVARSSNHLADGCRLGSLGGYCAGIPIHQCDQANTTTTALLRHHVRCFHCSAIDRGQARQIQGHRVLLLGRVPAWPA